MLHVQRQEACAGQRDLEFMRVHPDRGPEAAVARIAIHDGGRIGMLQDLGDDGQVRRAGQFDSKFHDTHRSHTRKTAPEHGGPTICDPP